MLRVNNLGMERSPLLAGGKKKLLNNSSRLPESRSENYAARRMRPARATVFLRVKYDKIIACHNMMEHAGRTPSRYFLRAARPPCFPRRAGARAEVDSRIACMFYQGLVCAACSKRGPAFICLVLSCSQAFGKIRECFATPQWLFRSLTRCCLSLHVNPGLCVFLR